MVMPNHPHDTTIEVRAACSCLNQGIERRACAPPHGYTVQVEQSIDDPEHGRDGHPRDVQARNQRGSAETQCSDNIASRQSGIRQADAGMIMAKLNNLAAENGRI